MRTLSTLEILGDVVEEIGSLTLANTHGLSNKVFLWKTLTHVSHGAFWNELHKFPPIWDEMIREFNSQTGVG